MGVGYVKHPAERKGGDLIRLHPAKGWQFWSWMRCAWRTDPYMPGEMTRHDALVRWEDTWCEPEYESGPVW